MGSIKRKGKSVLDLFSVLMLGLGNFMVALGTGLKIGSDVTERIYSANRHSAEWIETDRGAIICSRCNTWFENDERREFMLYCPYCGAFIGENKWESYQKKIC